MRITLLAHFAHHIHAHPEGFLWTLGIMFAIGLIGCALQGRAK